jgi:hypothetical protein
VPVSLLSSAEDRDRVNGMSFLEQHGRRQCSAKCCHFFGIDET